jgi:hypothetical protein
MNTNQDTTIAIWDNLYIAKYPDILTRSEEYISTFGIHITGDSGIDLESSRRWITGMINIDTMIEYYKSGIPFKVLNDSDLMKIYDSVSAHLVAWREYIKNTYNGTKAPYDDLMLMDEFANNLFESVKQSNLLNKASAPIIRRLLSSNLFEKRPNEELLKNKEKELSRDSLFDHFKNMKLGGY